METELSTRVDAALFSSSEREVKERRKREAGRRWAVRTEGRGGRVKQLVSIQGH